MKLPLTLAALALLGLQASVALGQAADPPAAAPAAETPAKAPDAPPGPAVITDPGCAPDCCQPDCCCECKKKCVAVPDTRKHTHTCYDCKCIDYCLPRCSLGGCKDCCEGDCTKCGHPRTKKVLLKRFVVEEECVSKCEVTHEMVPAKCKKWRWPWESKKACEEPCGDMMGPAMIGAPVEPPGIPKGAEPIGPPKVEPQE